MRRLTILVFLLAFSGLLAACGGADNSAPPSSPDARITATPTSTPAAPAPDIGIANFTYMVRGPVKAGQQVTVVNNDESSHSVTADAGNTFDIRVSGGGGTTTFTAPTTPGTYAFHCKYHTNMHGSLIVE